ncbi:MAG: transcriptional regulator [Sphingomonas sp.]
MSKTTRPESFVQALQRAVDAAGGQSALAREIGVSQPTLWGWLNGARVGAEQVLKLERATAIPRQLSRPDLYPDESGNDPVDALDRAAPRRDSGAPPPFPDAPHAHRRTAPGADASREAEKHVPQSADADRERGARA